MTAVRPKIIADSDIPFLEGVLEEYADMVYMKGTKITAKDAADADALIIRTRTKCDAALLDGSRVKLIATATIGSDHIDTDYCRANGIEVATAAGCNARGVLQYITGALAALARKEGWQPAEKTIGVVGVGNVGSLVAIYCKNFGFEVLCCDPPKKELCGSTDFISLDELLPRCGIVTLHVPLNREGRYKTEGMAGRDFFTKMPAGSTFINSSRGEVVNDGALVSALKTGHIKNAVIDTWNGEPHIDPELLDAATFTTPHIAGYSLQGKANGTAMAVRAAARCFSLPPDGWYPPQVRPVEPDPDITWDEVVKSIDNYFDIAAETSVLKKNPELFEKLRDNYNFRTEYF